MDKKWERIESEYDDDHSMDKPTPEEIEIARKVLSFADDEQLKKLTEPLQTSKYVTFTGRHGETLMFETRPSKMDTLWKSFRNRDKLVIHRINGKLGETQLGILFKNGFNAIPLLEHHCGVHHLYIDLTGDDIKSLIEALFYLGKIKENEMSFSHAKEVIKKPLPPTFERLYTYIIYKRPKLEKLKAKKRAEKMEKSMEDDEPIFK